MSENGSTQRASVEEVALAAAAMIEEFVRLLARYGLTREQAWDRIAKAWSQRLPGPPPSRLFSPPTLRPCAEAPRDAEEQGEPPCGPAPGRVFWWKGRFVKLTGMESAVVQALWHAPRRNLPVDQFCTKVWGDVTAEDTALRPQLSRLNRKLIEHRVPVSVCLRGDRVVLDVCEE